ncbi:MFS transporter, partial [Thermodesulfobacteriota bacterium]
MSKKPLRFYYGWVIIAVSFLTIFLSLGTRVSFGVFYVAILGEFGWGRAETAGAFSLALVCHAIFAPVTGTFIDRIGPRRLFPLGAILLFLGLLAASRINNIWHLYLIFGVMAIGINIISVAPHMSIVHRWFIRKKGLAIGLMMSGVGLGGLVLVPFSELMIETFSWRWAFIILSGIILCILLPLTAIFHRSYPTDVGQYPDGIVPEKDDSLNLHSERDAVSPEAQRSWSFASAIRVKSFWSLELAIMCEGLIMSMLWVHLAVFIVDVGYSKMFA